MIFVVMILDEVRTGGTEVVTDPTLKSVKFNSEFFFDRSLVIYFQLMSSRGNIVTPVFVNTKTVLRFTLCVAQITLDG